jgi:hypothetical protein
MLSNYPKIMVSAIFSASFFVGFGIRAMIASPENTQRDIGNDVIADQLASKANKKEISATLSNENDALLTNAVMGTDEQFDWANIKILLGEQTLPDNEQSLTAQEQKFYSKNEESINRFIDGVDALITAVSFMNDDCSNVRGFVMPQVEQLTFQYKEDAKIVDIEMATSFSENTLNEGRLNVIAATRGNLMPKMMSAGLKLADAMGECSLPEGYEDNQGL